METLVIKGHPTRGKEVIDILKMLGGNNIKEHYGESNLIYTIRKGDNVIVCRYPNSNISQIYTLEEFLEKFPYKVGDKVIDKIDECVGIVTEMRWEEYNSCVKYGVTFGHSVDFGWYSAQSLKTYKEEEVMEEKKLNNNASFLDCSMVEKIELALGNTHEVVVEDGKTFIVRKKTQYPKTYIKCAKILDCFNTVYIDGYKHELLEKLQELIICRDTYWKIAGDWKPDWENSTVTKYTISYFRGKIKLNKAHEYHYILAFPTEEMRDAFYENFKELIEQCKELL